VPCDIVIIREASPADHDAVSRLYAQVDGLHSKSRPDAFQDPPEPGRSRAFLDEHLKADDAAMFVAEVEGVVVGFAFAKLGRPPDDPLHRPRLFAYLEDLVVSVECRRKGIGTALMSEVERWASRRKVDHVELIVWEFNEDARRFYESLGYATSYRRMFRIAGS